MYKFLAVAALAMGSIGALSSDANAPTLKISVTHNGNTPLFITPLYTAQKQAGSGRRRTPLQLQRNVPAKVAVVYRHRFSATQVPARYFRPASARARPAVTQVPQSWTLPIRQMIASLPSWL